MSSEEEGIEAFERAAQETRVQDSHRRRFIYSDVEALIINGFLHQSVEIGDHSLVLRTIAGSDQMRLIARTGSSNYSEFSRWVISSYTWMVDGLDVSVDVNSPYHLMNGFVRELRQEYVTAIMSSIGSLRRRLDRALRIVEAFCYEPYGRASWRIQGKSVSREDNPVRGIWAAFNYAEDERLEDYRQWVHTRTTVASMTSKGAQHLARAEERIKEKEEGYRRKVIQDTVLWVYHGEDQEVSKGVPVIVTVNGQSMEVMSTKTAETREELEDEMQRWSSGEKDLHDLLVEDYFKNIRDRVHAQRAERQKALEEARALYDVEGTSGGVTELVGYTPEQLREMGVRSPSGTKTHSMPEGSSYLFDKYVESEIKMGGLDGNARPVPASPLRKAPQEEAESDPEETLQEKLERRTPTALPRLSENDS